jgi:DnaJ family protein C protein 9
VSDPHTSRSRRRERAKKRERNMTTGRDGDAVPRSGHNDMLLEATRGKKVSLYDALGVSKEATPHEIRKAYFSLARFVHPDRSTDPLAKERFQSLQKIYEVLSDPERRKLYDETGCVDQEEEAFSEDRCASLYEFYKKSFKEVTGDAIDKFKAGYKGSEEEMNDVLSYYEEFEGNMEAVFDHVMLSELEEDWERFASMIEDAVADGRLSSRFDSFDSWKNKMEGRKRKTSRKRKKGRSKPSVGEGDLGDLTRAILARRSNARNDQSVSGLAAFGEKFGVDMSFGDDPLESDEAFAKAQERMLSKRK